jgi:hypothetical protein
VPDPYFEQPGLAPLRAAASQAESSEEFRGLLSASGSPVPQGVLDRFGFRVWHLGTDGARLAAGDRDQETGARR